MKISFTILGEPASSRVTYIYALLDPDTGVPRYVGKSDDPLFRYRRHLKDTADTRLGRFATAMEAARAYNVAARAHGWPDDGLNPV